MHAESAAMPACRMRRSAFTAAVMLALVAAPVAAQQSLDAGGRVYGLVGGGLGDGTFVATGAGRRYQADAASWPGSGTDAPVGRCCGNAHARVRRDLCLWHVRRCGCAHRGLPRAPARHRPLVSVRLDRGPAAGGDDVPDAIHGRVSSSERASVPVSDRRRRGGSRDGTLQRRRRSDSLDPVGPAGYRRGRPRVGSINTVQFFDSTLFPSPGEYSELGLSLVLGGGVDVLCGAASGWAWMCAGCGSFAATTPSTRLRCPRG